MKEKELINKEFEITPLANGIVYNDIYYSSITELVSTIHKFNDSNYFTPLNLEREHCKKLKLKITLIAE